MAQPAPETDIKHVGKSSKPDYKNTKPEELPWYMAEVKDLEPDAKELFQKYCNVPAEDVRSHIKQSRDKAFQVFPYPCLGRFAFLELSISHSPQYGEVLQRIKDGNQYLDIGCCVGQDIRKLVFDGVPSENTYGADLSKDFMDIGYDLFADRSTLKTKFIAADIFDENSDLKQLDGQIDIVHAASFFHLFELDQQIQAAKRLVKIMKDQPGCLVFGRQIGNLNFGEEATSSFKEVKRFRHNEKSWDEVWQKVGAETGTKWEVDAQLGDEDLFAKAEAMGVKVGFIPPGARWLSFLVRRVA